MTVRFINYIKKTDNIKKVSEFYIRNYTYKKHDFEHMPYSAGNTYAGSTEYENSGLRLVEIMFGVPPSEVIYFPDDYYNHVYDCHTAHFTNVDKKTLTPVYHNRIIHNLTNYPRHSNTSYFSFSGNCIIIDEDKYITYDFARCLKQYCVKKKFIIIACCNDKHTLYREL